MTDTFFPTRQSPGYTHDWLKSSPDREFGIVAATIATGQGKIPSGGVVGKITATGKWGWYEPDAGDGREVPRGLLYYAVDASSDDVAVACITRRVVINPHAITWHESVGTQAAKDAALATLAEAEILTRHTL